MPSQTHNGTTLEYLTACVVAAEHNAHLRTLPRCEYTEVLAGSTGEDAMPCGSLAIAACDEHGQVCEFHAALCVLGVCEVEKV